MTASKPSIDWTHVTSEWRWLARDRDGRAYVYSGEEAPEEMMGQWNTIELTGCMPVVHLASYQPGDCAWKESLVGRPR